MTRTTADPTLPKYAPTGRDLPWNVMGGALSQKHTDYRLALMENGLDYDTRLIEVQGVSTDDEGRATVLEAPKHRAVVRPGPGGVGERIVGIVGTRFTPIQNRDAFAVANLLTAEFGATITGAADYRNGGASLLVLDLGAEAGVRLPDGTVDTTQINLLIKNAHDGSAALTFALTPIRLACTNALQGAIAGAKRVWKISHTPNAQERVRLAQDSILNALTYRDAFQATAQAMADQKMTDREFDKIIARLWPVEVKADAEPTRAQQNRLATRQEVLDLYQTSSTLDGARGTLWGGYNAITEWLDWGRPVRDGAVSRAEGALDGPYVRMKAKVWDLFAGAVA